MLRNDLIRKDNKNIGKKTEREWRLLPFCHKVAASEAHNRLIASVSFRQAAAFSSFLTDSSSKLDGCCSGSQKRADSPGGIQCSRCFSCDNFNFCAMP